jgi:hypothetical protein
MNTVSVLVKDAGFSNNLRSLVELGRFAIQSIINAHALKPVEHVADKHESALFAGVTNHDELEQRLHQRERAHLYALMVLGAKV